mgnify:CR=1 FL=1
MFKKIIALSSTLLALTFATSVLAETGTANSSATVTSKITCIGLAVSTRETSIDSAVSAFGQTINTAYTARASALAGSYGKTTMTAVKAGVKTAWENFNSSVKSARKTWQTARNAAWTQYRASATVCKAPVGTGDGVNSMSETSGN